MEQDNYISEILDPKKEEFLSDEFKLSEVYFDQVKSEIDLRIKLGDNEEFNIPEGYLEVGFEKRQSSLVRKVLYALTSTAAIFMIGFLVLTAKDAECTSFDCLLNETELTYEDLEYLEEYESDLLNFEEE